MFLFILFFTVCEGAAVAVDYVKATFGVKWLFITTCTMRNLYFADRKFIQVILKT